MIRCVVIGLGRIGFSLYLDPYREKPCTHTQAIILNRKTKLIAGIDIDSTKRKSFEQHTRVPTFSNWDSLLLHCGIPDIVFIATPPSSHIYYLRQALKSNVSVVVMEKPIATNYTEALALKNLYQRKHQHLTTRVLINHERRFADDYQYVKKIITSRQYGELLSINGTLFTNIPSSLSSLLHDGTHLIDIINYLSDGARSLTTQRLTGFKLLSKTRSQGIKKTIRFFVYINGIPTYIEIGGKKDFFHFESNLIFRKGKITIGNGIFSEYVAQKSNLYQGFFSLRKTNRSFKQTRYFANMLKHAVWLHQHPKENSHSSITDAFLIYQIIAKINTPKNLNKTIND